MNCAGAIDRIPFMIFHEDGGSEEREYDRALRPTDFRAFVGQDDIRENLRIAIEAATQRQEPLDHVLLAGPPGLGKTTLSHLVATHLGAELTISSGPALAAPKDLCGTLSRLGRGDVLFIDEIHRLPQNVEEFLYAAMEDSAIDIVLDPGPAGRSIRVPLEPFTLVGATTREGLLTGAFRSRFGLVERLEAYPAEHIHTILTRAAERLEFGIDANAANLLATRTRGVPRIALRILRRVRDLAQVSGKQRIDYESAKQGLKRLRIDDLGLEEMDRKILRALMDRGEPTGLKTLAAIVEESEDTIEDVFEPHLIRQGLITRTPRGRIVTQRAYAHLKITPKHSGDDFPFSL